MGENMRLSLAFLGLAVALGFTASARAITADAPEFRKLADGVYAYIGKQNNANAMVIVTFEGVVVVDTGPHLGEARHEARRPLRGSRRGQPGAWLRRAGSHGHALARLPSLWNLRATEKFPASSANFGRTGRSTSGPSSVEVGHGLPSYALGGSA
jgi:hypothetical protein